MTDWISLLEKLTTAQKGEDSDNLIDATIRLPTDEASETQFDTEVHDAVVRFWRLAVEKSTALLTRRDAAFALARYALNDDVDAADLLADQFRASLTASRTEFLAPQYLRALSILAFRNFPAETELLRILQRIKPDAPRYLLIRAAKVIGIYEGLKTTPTPALRVKLAEWSEADDLAVRAEARFQTAIITLGDTLQATDLSLLDARLLDCQVAFTRAALTEEVRDDSNIYVALVHLLRAFPVTDDILAATPEDIQSRCQDLERTVFGPDRPWRGYASKAEGVAQYRVLSVARAMSALAQSPVTTNSCTNYDRALTEVAALFLLLRHGSDEAPTYPSDPLRTVADPFALTYFGPLLNRAVGRQRFVVAIDNYVSENGEDSRAEALRGLYSAASAREYIGKDAITQEQMESVFKEAVKLPETLNFFLSNFPDARARYADTIPDNYRDTPSLNDFAVPLPIDYPSCYGNDPDVDETARKVFQEARTRLGNTFSRRMWGNFQDVVIFLIQRARILRDDSHPFTICSEDGGLGGLPGSATFRTTWRPLCKTGLE